VVAHPAQERQPSGWRGHPAPPASGAPHAGLACLVAQRVRAAAAPNPARPPATPH
jgi:hypothetical protein